MPLNKPFSSLSRRLPSFTFKRCQNYTGPSPTGYPLSSGLHTAFGLSNTTRRNICLRRRPLEMLRSCHWSTRCSPSFPILTKICILLLECIRNHSHKLPPCVIHLFQQTKLKERVNTLFGIDFPSRMSIESSIICC